MQTVDEKDMEITMYETLLQLPLFQGLGQNDITNIVGKIKLHFAKHKSGEKIISQGDVCNKLVFLLKGEVFSVSEDKNDIYTWTEVINAPFLIEPYSLFGMHTNYVSSYTAFSDIQTISIDKSFILAELSNYEIFRLNYYNILCNRAQILQEKVWNLTSKNVEEKIITFFVARAERMEGKKILNIKMEDMAMLLDDTRLSVSKVLNEFQEAGLVVLRRKEIEIPHLPSLIEAYKKTQL